MSSTGGEEAAVITHLLKVEKEAEELISGAQAEANKRAAEYKAKAEEMFKTQRDKIAKQIDASYKEQIDAIKQERGKEIAEYEKGMADIKQNMNAFNSLVSTVIKGK